MSVRIERLDVSVYRIPTEQPEADGTIQWDSTTMVLVEAIADSGERGLGFTDGAAACAPLIREMLAQVVIGCPVENVGAAWDAMVRAVRNIGRPGIASHAISAVDTALWDLKAKVFEKPLFQLLGARRESAPIYGSGGFTSYTDFASSGGDAGIPKVETQCYPANSAHLQLARRCKCRLRTSTHLHDLLSKSHTGASVHSALRSARRPTDLLRITCQSKVPDRLIKS